MNICLFPFKEFWWGNDFSKLEWYLHLCVTKKLFICLECSEFKRSLLYKSRSILITFFNSFGSDILYYYCPCDIDFFRKILPFLGLLSYSCSSWCGYTNHLRLHPYLRLRLWGGHLQKKDSLKYLKSLENTKCLKKNKTGNSRLLFVWKCLYFTVVFFLIHFSGWM